MNNEKRGCKSCGAPIFWASTVHGKPIPLDITPVEGGNIEVRGGQAHYLPKEEAAQGKHYVSHFVTCPHRDAWRKK